MKLPFSIRNVSGAVLVACGVLLILQREEDTGERAGFLLVGFAMLIAGFIMLSGSFTAFASRPLTGLIDRIYFGDNDREPPPVSLKLVRFYRQELRHTDAINECERQLEYHPHSLELWTEMIRSTRESGDREAARELYQKARRRLKTEDRALLKREISSADTWERLGGCKALR